jgi:hypothetical protein
MPSSFTMRPDLPKRIESLTGVQRNRNGAAEKIARQAQALAPDHGPGITGRYNDSIHVVERDGESHVVADVPYAAEIEAKYNTLGRAMHP